MPNKITVFLADDHNIVRAGLKVLLESDKSISVIGETDNGVDAVRDVQKLHPDIALMDISMPGVSGIDAAAALRKKGTETKIIFLSMYAEEEYVVTAINAGASGYLIKQSVSRSLIEAIKQVQAGRVYFSPEISGAVLNAANIPNYRKHKKRSDKEITNREREILKLLSGGKPNKKISALLFISVKTVEKHRQNIMRKLDIHDVASLTRYAIEKKII
ncbi:MAG: response regulator transcription factor [Candidatus Marinimicrobia bacterium]|jgi:DNA-binding NarL/FixJ family response regulator|nr:response regulator transcription factor [Candidatus Neomarinimicrobiota bacterium]MBT3675772.1 response regulator transcription factor [Candidatus Neomarinimicrobiota bacterium]MBT4067946.1 response regulator transcription factor [Candidatus Neomarinimicrobiota bacterium]MBT4308277.1 response regulator transcription factor [Candidatus Neomarinimicrobiota bacterium]MBT5176131.1 response regulator transcription factor [Candidatus Neomarinimicrobiota bacterium]